MLSSVLRQSVRPTTRAFSSATIRRAAEPKTKANSLINAVPGNSLLSKTGVIALGTGFAVFAVSKELIILHPETIVLGCFAGMVYFLSKNLSPIITAELDSRIEEIRKKLNASDEASKAALTQEIQETKDSFIAVPLAQEVFNIQREIVTLQKQLKESEIRKDVVNSIRSKLDYIVLLESQERADEQKEVLQLLRERILQSIKDPKFQETVLKKCVTDIEGISLAK